MLKISEIVEELVEQDELILSLGFEGLVNLSSYARKIHPKVEATLRKEVKEGSILAALTRYFQKHPKKGISPSSVPQVIQTLSVHSNLEGMTFERTEKASQMIREIYQKLSIENKSFFTVTQGMSEITVVSESKIAKEFRKEFKNFKKVYDKQNLVGIAIKFDLKYLDVPNTLFELYKRLAFKKINIVEIISTATELTFIIDKSELSITLEALQKNIY